MSNFLNNNSRFAGLVDNPEHNSASVKLMKKMGWKDGKKKDGIKEPAVVENNTFKADENKFNSFKDNGFRERRYNRYPSEQERQQLLDKYRAEEANKKELEKREQDRITQESLKIENFPELILNRKEKSDSIGQNYMNTLKKTEDVKIDKNANGDLEDLKSGWALIKKNTLTGKVITKYIKENQPPIQVSNETDIVNALAELHHKRTDQFIELNGYDVWEKMFKCPDWMEREIQLDDDSDYDSEYNSEYDYETEEDDTEC